MPLHKTFWDRFAFAYDTFQALNRRAYTEMLTQITARVRPDSRVLECAAGTGVISLALAPHARRVTCTDLSLPMLAHAKRKAQKRGLENIRFARRNLLRPPQKEKPYDMVIAANVVHLLPSPQAALHTLWGAVAPGGLLVVPTVLTGECGPGFRAMLAGYRVLGFRSQHAYTVQEYAGMLAASGLPAPQLQLLPGRVPVGLAVFTKDGAAGPETPR